MIEKPADQSQGEVKPEQWAENRVGELVGVCLCGIRQGLACVTRAARKFPVCNCSGAGPCHTQRQTSKQAGRGRLSCPIGK